MCNVLGFYPGEEGLLVYFFRLLSEYNRNWIDGVSNGDSTVKIMANRNPNKIGLVDPWVPGKSGNPQGRQKNL